MSRRHASRAVAANPVLVGAATTLVVLVAVFLSYNANRGLPFVPTYDVRIELPSAANLTTGNEVRLGGSRVGVVDEIRPKALPGGRVVAVLSLKLDEAIAPLPADSTVLVRPRSALGLKYVELQRGRAARTLARGATLPLAQAKVQPVEFDEALSTFDEPTRRAQGEVLTGLGDALAARGPALNVAVERLPGLLGDLRPVARVLGDDRTQLGPAIRALAGAAAAVAPVAERQASLFRGMDRTFSALAGVAGPWRDTLDEAPPTFAAGIRDLPAQRPFLRNASALFAELRPGLAALRGAAPTLASALETGTPAVRRSERLSARLEPTLRATRDFAEDPAVTTGLADLQDLTGRARPLLAHLRPVQTTCNYVSLLLRNAASILSEGDSEGTGQRFIIVATPQGKDNEGSPSSAPAAGPGDNFLHSNPYPNTASPGQARECEAGNETFLPGRRVVGNVPGLQGTSTEATR
jgi:virulence factor Mce-like protein